jgi:hypothetical protein
MKDNYLKKRDILEQALEAFQKTTGIIAKNKPSSSERRVGSERNSLTMR